MGTGLDPQLSAELGCEIELRDVAELCPEAATSRQRDRWRIFQFCCHLAKTQKAITQKARRYADPCRIALWIRLYPELDLQTIWG